MRRYVKRRSILSMNWELVDIANFAHCSDRIATARMREPISTWRCIAIRVLYRLLSLRYEWPGKSEETLFVNDRKPSPRHMK